MRAQRAWSSPLARVLCSRLEERDAVRAAERLADAARSKYGLLGPLDPRKFCTLLGVRCQSERLQIDALLSSDEGGYLIRVNSAVSQVRQRFSISHELGHLYLFETTQLTGALSHSVGSHSGAIASETESLCDAFAGSLLVPADEVFELTRKLGVTADLVSLLRSKYGISLDVCLRRIVGSGFWRCAIVLWDLKFDHGDLAELVPVRFWRSSYLGEVPWPAPIRSDSASAQPGTPLAAYSDRGASVGECLLRFGDEMLHVSCWSEPVHADRAYILTIILREPQALNLLRTWHNAGRKPERQANLKFD